MDDRKKPKPDRLAQEMALIRARDLRSPIVAGTTYSLVDGAFRYRVAKKLGLIKS